MTFLLIIGFFVQISGHILFIRRALQDPLDTFLLVTVGYGFVCVITFRHLIQKKVINGSPPKMNTIKNRIFPIIVFIIATVFFCFHSSKQLLGSGHNNPQPSIDIDTYKKSRGVFSLLEVFKVYWTGGGSYAVVNQESKSSQEYPLALIFNVDTSHPGGLYGTACALAFEAEVPSSYPWVKIDRIVVKVNNYELLPSYTSMLLQPFQSANVYYVEIGDTKESASSEFYANYHFTDDSRTDFGSVLLEKGRPESFVLRINAKTPGIYDFSVYLLVSFKNHKEKITLVDSVQFLFDGIEHH